MASRRSPSLHSHAVEGLREIHETPQSLRISPFKRTQGDGMEKVEQGTQNEQTIFLSAKEPENLGIVEETLRKPHQRPGSVVHLLPTPPQKKKEQFLLNIKNKEPKFVPYEPYKACVKPIVPNEIKKKVVRKESKGEAPKRSEKVEIEEDGVETAPTIWRLQKTALEAEIAALKTENDQLEKQYRFQVQVNGDLKNLLVAAVGEDMEVKVHGLTEDKLQLARALLTSAQSLSTHQEQTEWLAGQCEVWRSKFLASSVMVEELARWKASLTQKVNETQDILKKLLEERKTVRKYLLDTHENLLCLRDSFDLVNKRPTLKTTSILDLSLQNAKMSSVLVLQLLAIDKSTTYKYLQELPGSTPAEITAEKVLSCPHVLHLIGEPDAACSAVVGAAVALSGQLYLESHPPRIQCCPQCSGAIKLV